MQCNNITKTKQFETKIHEDWKSKNLKFVV